MGGHRLLGRQALIAPHGAQDRAVLREDRLGVDARRDLDDERRLQHLEDPAGEREQQLVARRLGQNRVERAVGGVERLGAGLVADGVRDRLLEPGDDTGVGVDRGATGDRHLERQPRVEQLGHRDALGREHQRDRLREVAAHPLAGRARHEDAARAPAADADQERRGQQPQRLAHRRPADAEVVGELLLGPDTLARGELLLLEPDADLRRDLFAGAGRVVQDLAAGPWAYRRHARRIRDHKSPNVLQYSAAVTSEHTVRTVTFDVLRRLELTTIFSNPGSTEVPFLAGLPDDLEFVLALHEGSAVAMAAGHAIGRGAPSLALLHSTPGLGNAVAALATARQNRAPVGVLGGQPDRRPLARSPCSPPSRPAAPARWSRSWPGGCRAWRATTRSGSISRCGRRTCPGASPAPTTRPPPAAGRRS